ncbi:hypothetical protein ACFFRR_007318 [Megaselia abdita]
MNYGRKTPSTYRSNPSIYSHATTRSYSNLNASSIKSKSLKSLKIPFYKKPIFKNNEFVDIQKFSFICGLFSIFVALFTILTAVFDIYCLAMAAPGSRHYGYYFISYEFVYVGNVHVRNSLIICALFSLVAGFVVLITSISLCIALRREHEKKIIPWLWTMAGFIILRFCTLLLFAIVNDLIFAYNVLIVFLWTVFLAALIYGWLTVYSLYLELKDLSKLEDLAHLRLGTMASMHSLAGSRPITPFTTPHSQHHSIV